MPFVFVYSPALLIVTQGFTWEAFFITLTGATLGIVMLAGAFTGFVVAPLNRIERIWLGLVALLFVAPGLTTMLIGIVLAIPVFLRQAIIWRKQRQAA